ncbi:hypothetical protein FSARC_5274 [Fusarium sarcochroum]|uniref:Gem-associated protein 5 TPR domain-containing protein n=1 Tax=Fusarium sarcochroum TaxID=1208366 RepID=A0A8H4X9P2_9HYPO|nr:hypothetical protein FSARC_5274 [Fusarium sarcochroum]
MSWDPCAATASCFLFASGSSIICCHHDNLAVQWAFRRHTNNVQLLAVDNQSGASAGRSVVSYDAGGTAIVWDLWTGIEEAQLRAGEHLTAAAWMANGNVAFGDAKGRIILFKPSRSEYTVLSTTNSTKLTALAPSPDCTTFALGYADGSLSIVTFLPRISLHSIATNECSSPPASLVASERPSSIVSLAWHASSLRKGSGTLAVQKRNGDLRVWSVPMKTGTDERPRVIRDLIKGEAPVQGPHWIGWSKGSCIIQYSNSQIHYWDVKTMTVIYRRIETPEYVRGMALYGPESKLFTLGANNTVQQFNLNSSLSPSESVVAKVLLPSDPLPPLPAALWKATEQSVTSATTIVMCMRVPEGDAHAVSSLSDLTGPQARGSDNTSYELVNPVFHASSRTPIRPSTTGHDDANAKPDGGRAPLTTCFPRVTGRLSSISSYSRFQADPSHDTLADPCESPVQDLFKFTRNLLREALAREAATMRNSSSAPDDTSHQMLNTILGWKGGVCGLIREEMNGHPKGSPSHILLSRWLGDIDTPFPNRSFKQMSASDWMLLALNGIKNHTSQQKLHHAYTQRLLEVGDLHTAVTLMLGMGSCNGAIEVYISQGCYMEALVLTSLVCPRDLQRQADIVKSWGLSARLHGQEQLASRCFACIDLKQKKLSTASQSNSHAADCTGSFPQTLGLSFQPSGPQGDTQRSISKSFDPKLVTLFDDETREYRLLASDGSKTPITTDMPVSRRTHGHMATTAMQVRTSNNRERFTSFSTLTHRPLPPIAEVFCDTDPEVPRPDTSSIPVSSYESG